MGLGSACLMIIGTLIGTGIFASPGPLFDSVHSTQTSFIIWAFAGLICIIGAFAYAELGTMFPESGGDFQYLSKAYGKKVGLIFGWSFITVLNPIGTAGIAGVLGRYSVDVIIYLRTGTSSGIESAGAAAPAAVSSMVSGPSGWIVEAVGVVASGGVGSILNGTGYYVPHAHSPYAPGTPAYEAASFPTQPIVQPHNADDMAWTIRAFAIGGILIMGLINIAFKDGGKIASNILALFKILGMLLLIAIGSKEAIKNHAKSEALSIPIGDSSQNWMDYVSALCFAFFAFNGFNNINLGLGELRDPEKNLKRAVWIAMPFVTVLFLLANFAFFAILPSYDLRHVHSLSLHAGHTVLGQPGGFLMAGTVIASALGSINANIWSGSRLLAIMAKDNTVVPTPVANVWARTGTQAIAILILIGQASFHAMINLDFKTFSKIYSAVGWSWYAISIAGLLYLRKKRPSYPRPVKVFWPLALMFVMVASFLVFGALSLAFSDVIKAPTKSPGAGDDEDEDEASQRYTPVIMFGGVILFISGVLPAFYLTRCLDRRRQRKAVSEPELSQVAQHDYTGDNNDNNCGHGGAEGGYLSAMENKGNKRRGRKHSSASSVTLVDESKRNPKENRHYRSREQGQGGTQAGSSHSRNHSPHFNGRNSSAYGHDEEEEEINRIQSLRVSRLQYGADGFEDVEIGQSERDSRYTSNSCAGVGAGVGVGAGAGIGDRELYTYFTSSGSSNQWSSPIDSTTPCESRCHSTTHSRSSSPLMGSSSADGLKRPMLLSLPGGFRYGSRSSETTLGLEADYNMQQEEKPGREAYYWDSFETNQQGERAVHERRVERGEETQRTRQLSIEELN
ncbi:hypothetical protein BG011_009487 [Mortierella polycephala]|uniref:Amino acid transporter n=1 Tax=Mortierella polycephala TaxID=41804 RepID=A0A9P6U7H6_9FUNG|nr:hypothetical protein BG011_009487 [Mortierella polycephala]